MAERAFQTAEHFSEYIVEPNLQFFRQNSASLQAAFNAVLCVDALSAHIFQKYKTKSLSHLKDDTDFRNELASADENFHILRDIAKSYKHVVLDRGTPLIRKASQTAVGHRPYGSGLYGVGTYDGEEIMIELSDGAVKHCLSIVILAYEFLLENFNI